MNWWRFVRQPTATERRAHAAREARHLATRGEKLSPVVIDGRAIAQTFWGKAWCENLESYSDYAYRLPRGRSYARNGAVLDLKVSAGEVKALVCGTALYRVRIKVKPLAPARWKRLRTQCAGEIGSLVELLQGRLADRVMRLVTHREQGLFPKPSEIEMSCSCPDWATMCKHVAATLYGVGARLDAAPELLFTLRKVDHAELITRAADLEVTRRSARRKTLSADALESVFGIELDAPPSRARARSGSARTVGLALRSAAGPVRAKATRRK